MGWLRLDVILRRSSENSSESTIQTYMGASIKEIGTIWECLWIQLYKWTNRDGRYKIDYLGCNTLKTILHVYIHNLYLIFCTGEKPTMDTLPVAGRLEIYSKSITDRLVIFDQIFLFHSFFC
jgi:hypothetical protein